MDWKTKSEEMKKQAAEKGEAKPHHESDAEDMAAKTRELAEAAKARLGEIKARLDKDGDGKPDAGMPTLTEEQRQALEDAKAKAKAAQEKLAKKPEEPA